MASEQRKHERRAQAVERLSAAKTKVAELLGFEAEEAPLTRLDPELAQIQQTEDVATFLETVALTIEKERAAPPEESAPDEKKTARRKRSAD